MEKNRGFSLVELIVVIAIMAILIGVLAPQYVKYVERSRVSSDEKIARELLEMANVITVDEDFYSLVELNDQITFSSQGIRSTNEEIERQILPVYISGWQGVKVCSKKYSSKCYKIQFVPDVAENKVAIQVGWE